MVKYVSQLGQQSVPTVSVEGSLETMVTSYKNKEVVVSVWAVSRRELSNNTEIRDRHSPSLALREGVNNAVPLKLDAS